AVLSKCGGYCGPGFEDLFPIQGVRPFLAIAMAVVAAAALAWSLLRRRGDRVLDRPMRPALMLTRIATSVVLTATVVVVATVAVRKGMPPMVDLPRMFGWPILLLAG